MSTEEILRTGIAAAKAGDLERAAACFVRVVQADPSSEQGWFLLGMCRSDPGQRRYCLQRVLEINPNNRQAREQLARLTRPEVRASTPPPHLEQSGRPAAPESAPPQVPPASTENRLEASPRSIPPQAVAAARKQNPKKKKTNQTLLVLLLGGTSIILICGLAFGYLFLSGQLAGLIPPGLPTPGVSVALPIPTLPTASIPATDATSPTPLQPTVIPSPLPTVSYTPGLEKASCWFDIPDGVSVDCGFVIVPEDRSGDPSHTIRLAYAVYHSTGFSASPYPVIFLQGGPGGEAVKLSADAYPYLVAPFVEKHDFIAFDQRGTGLSEPALNCDELTKTFSQDIHGLIPGSTRSLVYSNSILSCRGLMSSQGINLNAYTTIASAADVRDLLSVLGYEKADLYGASYGTRLAQVIMRDDPEIVNSVVLDSVVPIETNFFSAFPDSIESALGKLFQACAADPNCNAAYPGLESTFWDLLAQLDAQPVSITTSSYPNGTITEKVDGSTFMDVILGSLKQSDLIATAPQTIYRFKDGDYSTLIVAQSSLPFTFQDISPGLYISMMCHEHILATTPDQLQAAVSGRQDIREYAWLPFYGDAAQLFQTCKSWGAEGPRQGENDPFTSDIPTLIITGKYDPTTPPMYAQQVAGHLSHSYYFEFPNQGHTPTAADASGCAMDTVLAFLDNPSVEPDRSCLENMQDVHFLIPYTGTPPLSLRTVSAGGISIKMPEGWSSAGNGFYIRGNSPLDITQAGALLVNASPEELEGWFSSKGYGYSGLDTPLVQTDQRQAHGFDWTLYTSSSYGRPVDIAMADYGGRSLVVLLFCNTDEHDALYQTVFLPMVDSARP